MNEELDPVLEELIARYRHLAKTSEGVERAQQEEGRSEEEQEHLEKTQEGLQKALRKTAHEFVQRLPLGEPTKFARAPKDQGTGLPAGDQATPFEPIEGQEQFEDVDQEEEQPEQGGIAREPASEPGKFARSIAGGAREKLIGGIESGLGQHGPFTDFLKGMIRPALTGASEAAFPGLFGSEGAAGGGIGGMFSAPDDMRGEGTGEQSEVTTKLDEILKVLQDIKAALEKSPGAPESGAGPQPDGSFRESLDGTAKQAAARAAGATLSPAESNTSSSSGDLTSHVTNTLLRIAINTAIAAV